MNVEWQLINRHLVRVDAETMCANLPKSSTNQASQEYIYTKVKCANAETEHEQYSSGHQTRTKPDHTRSKLVRIIEEPF